MKNTNMVKYKTFDIQLSTLNFFTKLLFFSLTLKPQ